MKHLIKKIAEYKDEYEKIENVIGKTLTQEIVFGPIDETKNSYAERENFIIDGQSLGNLSNEEAINFSKELGLINGPDGDFVIPVGAKLVAAKEEINDTFEMVFRVNGHTIKCWVYFGDNSGEDVNEELERYFN